MKKNNTYSLIKDLEESIIVTLKENINLKECLNNLKAESNDKIKSFGMELISILDILDTKFENYQEKIDDKSISEEAEKVVKNFESVRRKILRILENYKIVVIKFEDNKAKIGYCRILATKPDPSLENESILYIIKKGYTLNGELLRIAEVVTVKN